MSRLFFIPKAVRVNTSGTPYAAAKAFFYLTGTTTATDTYQNSALSTPHTNPVVADSGGQFAAIYLDPAVTYRCIIKDSSDNTLDDVDPVQAPITGAQITITDAGGYFAGTEVETILQDLGANYAKKSAANTWSADQTFSSAVLKMADNIIERPAIKDYGVTHNAVTSTTNAVSLDLSTGNSFYHLLTENTTITPSNPPASGTFGQFTIIIQQDAGGGAYTVAWAASVNWAGGSAPTISTGNSAIDIVTALTIDGGTTWYANFAQAYA